MRSIECIVKILIYKIVKQIRKKTNLWVFGAWRGQIYADNSKYMFEYINKNHPEINAVWITKNKNVIQTICLRGYTVYHRRSIKGLLALIRANVAVVTEGSHDLCAFAIAGAKIIQLWHGMGIKDVTMFLPISQNKLYAKYLSLAYSHKNQYWMTACRDAVTKYSKAFNIPQSRMYITGQPKDDTFVLESNNQFINSLREKYPGYKIVAYLPTHRNLGKHELMEWMNSSNLQHINNMLILEKIILIIKPHVHEFSNYLNVGVDMSNIVFAIGDAFSDIYEFLPSCDAMITDYSGIMFGYLACGKPIIYFPYDMDYYISADAGLSFTYDEVTAGPICKTWSEVISATAEILENDLYKEQRENLRKRFSPYNDGLNRKRVYDQIMQIVDDIESVV